MGFRYTVFVFASLALVSSFKVHPRIPSKALSILDADSGGVADRDLTVGKYVVTSQNMQVFDKYNNGSVVATLQIGEVIQVDQVYSPTYTMGYLEDPDVAGWIPLYWGHETVHSERDLYEIGKKVTSEFTFVTKENKCVPLNVGIIAAETTVNVTEVQDVHCDVWGRIQCKTPDVCWVPLKIRSPASAAWRYIGDLKSRDKPLWNNKGVDLGTIVATRGGEQLLKRDPSSGYYFYTGKTLKKGEKIAIEAEEVLNCTRARVLLAELDNGGRVHGWITIQNPMGEWTVSHKSLTSFATREWTAKANGETSMELLKYNLVSVGPHPFSMYIGTLMNGTKVTVSEVRQVPSTTIGRIHSKDGEEPSWVVIRTEQGGPGVAPWQFARPVSPEVRKSIRSLV